MKIKNKQKTYVLKESDIKKLKRDITKEVSSMAIYIFLAWLKDTEYISNNPETLVEEYTRLEGWFNAIDDHLISVNDIKKIIEDSTEMKIKIREGEETRIEHGK